MHKRESGERRGNRMSNHIREKKKRTSLEKNYQKTDTCWSSAFFSDAAFLRDALF